uniref:Cytokine receptor-like factor 2-like D1 domain-containing protein n=1 Tax=Oryzias sinensis TaxID=183150 RepID=A0A8C7ZTB7_9TELE
MVTSTNVHSLSSVCFQSVRLVYSSLFPLYQLTGNETNDGKVDYTQQEQRDDHVSVLEAACFLSATMLALLLLIFSLNGCLLAKEAPDVDCLVVNLEYVSCSWKKSTDGNYTFTSWFEGDTVLECAEYLPGNSTHTGCNRPYSKQRRFDPFYTVLKNGNDSSQALKQEHQLQTKVKLNPPTNVTVKYGSDQNLWFYWNQTYKACMESEVRHRKKQMKWEVGSFLFLFLNKFFHVSVFLLFSFSIILSFKAFFFLQHSKVFRDQSYCINLPASNSRYELQVRIKLDSACGGGPDYWSEWSEPAIWGSNNSTGRTPKCTGTV